MESYGLVMLAAGSSNRMGQPKQLLAYRGKALIEYILQIALSSICKQIAVVLGANADQILPYVQQQDVLIVQNKDWKEGMASSIRCGLSALTNQFPSLAGAIFMVCDQPFVSVSLINDLVDKKKSTGKSIIACTYKETMGTPALFSSMHFPELMQLQGQDGAKKILWQHAGELETISFPMGYIDIDTMQDYQNLGSLAGGEG